MTANRIEEAVGEIITFCEETERVNLSDCSKETMVDIEAIMYTLRIVTNKAKEIRSSLQAEESKRYTQKDLCNAYKKGHADGVLNKPVLDEFECFAEVGEMEELVEVNIKGIVSNSDRKYGTCALCGAHIESNDNKCPGCGTKLIWYK